MGVTGAAAEPMVAQLQRSLQDQRFSVALTSVLERQPEPPQVPILVRETIGFYSWSLSQ